MKRSIGFSVVETIVVVGLISVLSVVLVDIFLVHGRLFNSEATNSNLQQQGNSAMSVLGAFLRNASRVVQSRTINSQSFSTSGNTLILELPSVDASSEVIPSTYDYVVFYKSGSKLWASLEPNSASSRGNFTKVLGDAVGDVKFIYDNSSYDSVKTLVVDLTLSKSVLGKTYSFHLGEKFSLANNVAF